MCKSFLNKLMGGDTPKAGAPAPAEAPVEAAEVKNSALVEAQGKDPSGRVNLGKSSKRQARVAGLSI